MIPRFDLSERWKRGSARGVLLAFIVTACELLPALAGDNRSISAAKISLPSGPGSIEGLGESFEPQLNTGTYAMGLPLKLPGTRGAVQPEVRLSYNSGSGNGPVGLGWRLDVPSVQRQTDKGLPRYDATDTFIDDAGEELVRLSDGITYRAENEAAFNHWENLGAAGWRATRRDGVVLRFGQTAQARQDHPTLGTFKWMLESAEDLNGNRVLYTYVKDGGQIYPGAVEFGRHTAQPSSIYRLTFTYETNRLDALTDYRGRFRCETRWRLASATLEFEGRRIRFWRFQYHTNSPLSLLASFTQFGDSRSATGTIAVLNRDFLPPVTFDYAPAQIGGNRQWADVAPFQNIRFSAREADLVDLNRDGLPDVLLYDDGKYHSYLNRGPGRSLGSPQEFTSSVFYPRLDAPTTRLADLRGDATVKVLVEDTGNYYYRAFTGPTTLGAAIEYLVPGTFPISDPEVQLVDIDNDRALDFIATDQGDSTFAMVLSRAGKGSASVLKSPPTPLAMTVNFAQGWQFADMNGDRMPDLVIIGTVEEGGTFFHPGKGFGEFDERQRMGNGPAGPSEGDRAGGGLTLVDIDGDGLADLVSVRSGVVKIWANRAGREWAAPMTITDSQVPLWNGGTTAIRFADMNGNGSVDIVWNDPDEGIFLRYLDLNPDTKPNVMTRMANGMGRSLAIEYRTSTDYMLAAAGTSDAWTTMPPFPVSVVSAFVERDGLGGAYRTEITYRNGYYDATEREFRGFETAIRRDLGNDAQGAPSLLTEYRFDTGATNEAMKGKPLQVERRTVTGEIFDRVSTVWTNRQLPVARATNEARRVTFACQSSEQTEVIERGNGAPVTLLREFQWDDYGNQTRLSDFGRVEGSNRSAWDDERITIRSFTSAFPDGTNRWILGLPVAETITDEHGAVITQTEYFYDDESFAGNNAGSVSRGNLTLQRRLANPQTGYKIAQVRQRYDAFGNVIEMYDPLGLPSNFANGHAREIRYDTNLHTYPILETVHVGGATPALLVSAGYDFGLGVMTSFTDFNTNSSFCEYDTFARLASITRPGDTTNAPTELYSYQLGIGLAGNRFINFITASKRESANGGTLDSRLFFDGLGRKVMVRAEGETTGQTVVSDTVSYNDRRGIWKKYLPYFDSGGLDWKEPSYNSGFVENQHDAVGRVTRAYQPDVDGERVFAETVYEPLARLVKDEEQTRASSIHFGSAMRHVEDGLFNKDGGGRLRQVQEIVKRTGTDAVPGPVETWTTTYEYDLLDQLTRIVDSQNNVKLMRYDSLARRTFMDDPDRGEMHYVYDDASNLKQTTDNKGQIIQYSYDGANRIQTEDYRDAAGRNPDVEYFYDASLPGFPGQNVRGQLAAVRDLSGEEHFSYDARGRIMAETKRIPDPQFLSAGTVVLVSFTTAYTYDSMDRVVTLTYPDGDMVTNLYNSRGLLTRITGGPSGSIISNINYRASAQLEEIRYGNNVRTAYDYDPRLRLTSLLTHHVERASEPLIHFTYTFDAASNIHRIQDNRDLTGQPDALARKNTQIFEYDSLYRLTRAEYPAILGGAPGSIDYRYDRIGNMTAQRSNIPHLENGKSVTDLGSMISGGAAGSSGRTGKGTQPGPHALSQSRNAQSAVREYEYDPNGNMTNVDGLHCTWDFKDRLVAAENEAMRAVYTYDYTDRRIIKRVWPKESSQPSTFNPQPSSVLYPNKYFEVREHDAPTKYVWNGNTRVARVSGSLSTNLRIQRLRVWPGWNLCSLAVSSPSPLWGEGRGELFSAAFRWNPLTLGWDEVLPSENLPAGTILWLNATSNAILAITGTYSEPTSRDIPAEGDFLPSGGLESWDSKSAISNLFSPSVWTFDAFAARWVSSHASPLEVQSDLPAFIGPGQAMFVRITNAANLDVPDAARRISFYHQDHLGSSSVLTDSQGNVCQETTYYPSGLARHLRFEPAHLSDYSFSQKERDRENGLHYFEARFLFTTSARFVRADPALAQQTAKRLLNPQTFNSYSYADNNPIRLVDPSGKAASDASGLSLAPSGELQYTPTSSASPLTPGRLSIIDMNVTEGVSGTFHFSLKETASKLSHLGAAADALAAAMRKAGVRLDTSGHLRLKGMGNQYFTTRWAGADVGNLKLFRSAGHIASVAGAADAILSWQEAGEQFKTDNISAERWAYKMGSTYLSLLAGTFNPIVGAAIGLGAGWAEQIYDDPGETVPRAQQMIPRPWEPKF